MKKPTLRFLIFFSVMALFFEACSSPKKSNETFETTPQDSINSTEILTETDDLDTFQVQGNAIAKASFKALSGKLKGAVQSGGIASAIQYCNVHAIPLTDSLSRVYNTEIQRVSDRNRNSVNALSASDSVVFADFQANPNQDSKVMKYGENILFYKPILLKPLCLNCHGELGKTLPEANQKVITELYPEDKAVGYQIGELRGMWKIRFR